MADEESFDPEAMYEEAVKSDTENIKVALNRLIDDLSPFMAAERMDDLTPQDFASLLESLDFNKFVVSGVMYTHGLPYCGHDHSGDE